MQIFNWFYNHTGTQVEKYTANIHYHLLSCSVGAQSGLDSSISHADLPSRHKKYTEINETKNTTVKQLLCKQHKYILRCIL